MSESMYWVLLAERFCYYGMFFSMMWIQWQICGLPGRVYVPACAAGFLICLSVLIQPLIPAETAGTLYTYGNILGLYKWFTAFWLLATSGWAVCKKRPCCLAVLPQKQKQRNAIAPYGLENRLTAPRHRHMAPMRKAAIIAAPCIKSRSSEVLDTSCGTPKAGGYTMPL